MDTRARSLQPDQLEKDPFANLSAPILSILVSPASNRHLTHEFDSASVCFREQKYPFSVLKMISHCRVPPFEPHVAMLTLTGIVKGVPLPVVLVAKLLAPLSGENKNIRVLAGCADPTSALSAVHVVDFLSKEGLTRLKRQDHYRSNP